MCGRYTLTSLPEEIRVEFDVEVPPEYGPRYNIAPSQPVPVLGAGADGKPRLAVMRWGLVPFWAASPKDVPHSINARAETLLEKPMFRDAFLQRRCLVIADGFYEWRRTGGARQPFRFHRLDERPFTFAGIWDRWRSPEGDTLYSCAIVTTGANSVVNPIHDRMPVIIDAADRALWLDNSADPAHLAGKLGTAEYASFEAYPVSTLVNSVANDTADCIAAVPGVS